MTVVYGIPNCDKCRKARKWFDRKGHKYRFHDLRVDGIDSAMADNWLSRHDADALLNRRSTTWRSLNDKQRSSATSKPGFTNLLLENPTLLKRPLVDTGDQLIVGYDEAAWLEVI